MRTGKRCVKSFERRGFFFGELLERAVDTVCRDKDTSVAMMMADEHALTDVDRRASLRSSAVVGAASLVASIGRVPPFAIARGMLATGLAIAIGLLLLLALGAFEARLTTGSAGRSAVALAAIGLASAFAGYAVGALFAARR